MTFKHLPLRLIGLLVLAYVLYIVDLQAVAEQVRRIGPASILGAGAAFCVLLGARCVRWHLLARRIAPQSTFAANMVGCNASIWLGLATPGRLGEFSRALDLSRRSDVALAETSGLVFFDLIIDLSAYAALGLAGIAMLALRGHAPLDAVLYAAILVAALAGLVLLPRLGTLVGRLWPGVHRFRAFAIVPALAARTTLPTSAALAATTFLAAFAYATMIAFLAAPMQLGLGPIQWLTMVGLVALSGAIPITYFGFGTREVTLIWFFAGLGLSSASAVAVSFSFVLAQLIGIVVSLGVALFARAARLAPSP